MAARDEYIDIKDAMKTVVKVLKEYESLNYSRLLMATELPQHILERTLHLLEQNKVIEQQGNDDAIFRLTSRGSGSRSFWSFS